MAEQVCPNCGKALVVGEEGPFCTTCNPQRPMVLAMERRHIEGVAFVHMRLRGALASAAAICFTPAARTDIETFVQLAREAHEAVEHAYQEYIEDEVARRDNTLSDNTNSNEEKPS